MQPREKLTMMDKIIRELEDIINSQTSVLKKLSQLEAENINLGDKFLEKKLPDIHEHIDTSLTETTALLDEYRELHAKFVKDNKLDEPVPEA
ncbi:MAG: hypothetical protein ABI405_09730 [Parafilimonas sp.]